MLVVDYLKHKSEKSAKNFIEIFQVKTHVERFDICQIFKKVKVSLKGWIFWIF